MILSLAFGMIFIYSLFLVKAAEEDKKSEALYNENGFGISDNSYEPAVWNDEENHYEISNAGQLFWFAQKVNTGTSTPMDAALMCDITVNDKVCKEDGTIIEGIREWTSIGSSEKPYIGTFQGNGHSVSGIYIDADDRDYVGFFGKMTQADSWIYDVYLKHCYVKGRDYTGGICGHSTERIEGCQYEGIVDGQDYTGGICGGIGERIVSCTSYANVTGRNMVGGICGYSICWIEKCKNLGQCKGKDIVGGVCGNVKSGVVIRCENEGNVTGESCTGGVCGENRSGSLRVSINSGNIHGSTICGGVVGRNMTKVIDCYNTGDIFGVSFAGGIAGLNNSRTKGTIVRCYSIGKIRKGKGFGGICGSCMGEAKVTNCYYLYGTPGDRYGIQEEKDAFRTGKVAWLLDAYRLGSDREKVWSQGKDHPVFKDLDHKYVYKVSFTGEKLEPVYTDADGRCIGLYEGYEYKLKGEDFSCDTEVFKDCSVEAKKNIIISAEIAWGNMQFTYHEGRWNPDRNEYEEGIWSAEDDGNIITVKNTGNAPINLEFSYEDRDSDITDVTVDFYREPLCTCLISDDMGGFRESKIGVKEDKKIYIGVKGKPSESIDGVAGRVVISIKD